MQEHLIPKSDTGVSEFIAKYNCNGSNCRVGILDTGIDPNAIGLTVGNNSAPDERCVAQGQKLIDMVDCTGSGDVDCSTTATASLVLDGSSKNNKSTNNNPKNPSSGNYRVTGLSGHVLYLPVDWQIAPSFPVAARKAAFADTIVTTTTTSRDNELDKSDENNNKAKDGPSTHATACTNKDSKMEEKSTNMSTAIDDAHDVAETKCRPNNQDQPSLGNKGIVNTGKDMHPCPFATTSTTNTTTTTPATTVQVRLGVKHAYELFPAKLRTRLEKERIKWLQKQLGPAEAEARACLTKLQAANKKPSQQVKLQMADYQERVNILQHYLTCDNNDNDPPATGPLLDLVVFWNGRQNRVALYLAGELVTSRPLTDFDVEHEFVCLSTSSQMNVAVHIYNHDDVCIVSLIADASPHGTHVAGICASNSDNANHGVAPGAELVSLKIGDSRLESMETGAALTRALQQAIRSKCDVVNLSYGEGCQVPNAGRFVELLQEMVYKHNIIFVSSAGNNGPALSTVGAPGGTSTATIAVAAHISPESMKVNYSLNLDPGGNTDNDDGRHASSSSELTIPSTIEQSHSLGTTYTWSSVGPAVDGCAGVNVTAPGGAITCVSNWCLQRYMLMNGTSMSSPHAAGCVALLVSACKSRHIPVSPARIQRALQNTAKRLPGLLTVQQGSGMIQVCAAMEYLEKFSNAKGEDLRFAVTIENRENARGIYLRDQIESSLKNSFVVRIDPNFPRQDLATEDMQRQKIEFEMEFALHVTGSNSSDYVNRTVDWVRAPDHFILMNQGRTFKVNVDPTGLNPGVHEAAVHGLDAEKPERGPLFTVPITVVKPLPVDRLISLGMLVFEPAEVKRFFVVPPAGATWMDITVKDCRDAVTTAATTSGTVDSSTKLFVLHTVQLLPHAAYRDYEKQKHMNLRPGQVSVTSIAVEEGVVCEVDLARYWSTAGESSLEMSIEFRGVRPVPNHVHMLCGAWGKMVRFYSDLADEYVCPKVTLNKWLTPVRPKADPVLSPLDERHQLPSLCKVIYQLILEYEFDQDEKGSFVPRLFGLQGVLYESAFESQLLLVFDGEKKYLGAADAWPSEITAPKGKVVVRSQIRHDDPNKLEKLKDMPLWIERSIEKEISLSVYPTKEASMKGSGTFKRRLLRKGSCASAFVAEPTKIPSGCKMGDILQGSMTFANADAALPGDGKRPGGFPFSLSIGPKSKKSSSDSETTEKLEDKRTVEEKMNEAIRDAKVEQLEKLTKKEKDEGLFKEWYGKLEDEYGDYLPFRMLNLRHLDMHKDRLNMLEDIVKAGTAVLSMLPEADLAMHFGRKIDTDDPEAVKGREKMKEKKAILIETFVRIALAYCDMKTDDAKTKFGDTLQRLKAWADIDGSDKYAALVIERETAEGRYGNALKLVNKLLAKESCKEDAIKPISRFDLYQKKVELLEKLGYTMLAEYEKSNRVIACPKLYALF